MELLFAFAIFAVVLLVVAIIYYNKIIKLKVQVKEGWSDIQVQLKRRHNLIENLVNTVQGYATHEQETLKKVVQARNAAKDSEGKDIATVQSLERTLESALSGLKINALSEAYPDLKANQNFLQLQAELSDTENKISAARRFYNNTVMNFNTVIQQIPGRFFAGIASAIKAEFFEIDEDQKVTEVPQVNFKAKPEEKAAAAPEAKAEVPAEAPKAEEKPAESAPTAPAEEKKEEAPKAEAPAEAPKTEEKPSEEPKDEEKSE